MLPVDGPLSLANKIPNSVQVATCRHTIIGNMAPEYGGTCGFFPIENKVLMLA